MKGPKPKQMEFCTAPDRHVPAMRCGFPLPCPHHTPEGTHHSRGRADRKTAAAPHAIETPCHSTHLWNLSGVRVARHLREIPLITLSGCLLAADEKKGKAGSTLWFAH